MFQVGDAVVHPGYGAGKVVNIEQLSCLGSDKQYYSIHLLDGSETLVWVPVEEAESKGIRSPTPKSEVQEIWHRLRTEAEELPSDHNKRYEIIREKLENGNILQIAEALRDLSWKDYHVRNLTSEGKRLYDKGLKLLATELAVVKDGDPEEIEAEISNALTESVTSKNPD